MFIIADCEKHVTFSHTKHYPISLPLKKLCYLLGPTRAQNDAKLKEFCVTQWGQLPRKRDDSVCSIKSDTTDVLHMCLSRNKDSADKDCTLWGGWCFPRARGKICWHHGHSHQMSCWQIQQQLDEERTGLLQSPEVHKAASNISSTRKPFNQTWVVSCKEETFLIYLYLPASYV